MCLSKCLNILFSLQRMPPGYGPPYMPMMEGRRSPLGPGPYPPRAGEGPPGPTPPGPIPPHLLNGRRSPLDSVPTTPQNNRSCPVLLHRLSPLGPGLHVFRCILVMCSMPVSVDSV